MCANVSLVTTSQQTAANVFLDAQMEMNNTMVENVFASQAVATETKYVQSVPLIQ